MRLYQDKLTDKIFIGTCGFSYASWHKKDGFYANSEEKEELSHYVKKFNFVEINNTFYREPTLASIQKWKNLAPENFIFAVKANKFFTHIKHLVVDEEFKDKWHSFWEKCALLKPKLGPLLFQLPFLKFNTVGKNSMLDRLERLGELLPSHEKIVFECRDTSWDCEEVGAIFKKYNWCFAIIHTANQTGWAGNIKSGFFPTKQELWSTANWGHYFRLHGSEGRYYGSYDAIILQQVVSSIVNTTQPSNQNFVAFNNTFEENLVSAIKNAFTLQALLANTSSQCNKKSL